MLPRDGKKTVEPEAGICTIGSDGAEWNEYRDMGRQTEVWILVLHLFAWEGYLPSLGLSFLIRKMGLIVITFQKGWVKIKLLSMC